MKLRPYLLGIVSEQEQNEIEERYFADDEYFENMLAAEDELVEAYVSGELTRRERKRFDECLLPNTRWQQKVANIQALKRVVNEEKFRVSPAKLTLFQRFADFCQHFWASIFKQKIAIGLAYATVLVCLVLGSVWVGRQFQNFQQKIVTLETSQHELAQEADKLRQQLQQQTRLANEFSAKFEQEKQQRLNLEKLIVQKQSQPTPMLAFVLEPGILRDAESQRRLVIPANLPSVRFDLLIEAEPAYQSYQVVVKTVEGNEVWSRRSLMSHPQAWGQTLTLNLPAIALNMNDYIVTLSGITATGKTEVIHRYFFSVSRK